MLRRARPAALAIAAAVAIVSAVVAPAAATGSTTPAAVPRAMSVAPAIGLPGLVVRYSGRHVPRHVTYRVYFDVTSSDKVLVCSGNDGRATSWSCRGRIPMRYGALGAHTVEMDATGAKGHGSFEELSTFLVSDLGVTMAAPATTAQGDTLQLRVTAANGDATTATDVRLHDKVPAGLRIEKVTAPCVQRRGLVSCGPLKLAPHSARVVVITVVVTATHRVHLTDEVSITGRPDTIKRNDTATASITVT